MSTHTDLVVLALPHGPDPDRAGHILISTVMMPRLSGGGVLTDHPDWIDWPAVLSGLTLRPVINGFAAIPAEIAQLSTPSSDHWTAVFPRPASVHVPTFIYDPPLPDGVEPRSYPEAAVAERLEEIWRTLAVEHPSTPPTVGEAKAAFGGDLGLHVPALRDFLGGPTARGAEDDGRLDFNTALSVLRRHPGLCEVLGLTIELSVDVQSMRQRGMPTINYGTPLDPIPYGVQVGCDYAVGIPRREAAFPTTLAGEDWRPAHRSPISRGGQLDLELPEFQWGIGHTLAAALELARRLEGAADDAPLPNPLTLRPPLELRHRSRAARERGRLDRQLEVEQDLRFQDRDPADGEAVPTVHLDAEDIAATYRADILGGPHAETTLRSLHERWAPGGYAFDPTSNVDPLVPDPDEGWVSAIYVTEAGQTTPKLPQSLLRWDGWSLSASRPVNRLDPETGLIEPTETNAPTKDDDVAFGVDYAAVPGTLPRLAYGHDYTLRCRLVDVAGNSIPNRDEDAVVHPTRAFYARYTPLAAPVAVRRTPSPDITAPGDTSREIVITTDLGQSADDVAPADRLLMPAPSAAQEWELMDRPADLFTAEGHSRLARLDARGLDTQLVTDPVTGDRIAGRLEDGQVVAGPVEQVADYLRDPAVRGVRLTDLPGQDEGDAILMDHPVVDGERLGSTRIVVAPGVGRPELSTDPADPGVHVKLPPAAIVRVRMVSTMDPTLADRFALHRVLGGDADAFTDGQHWMASHGTTLTLIHAIPLPRTAPRFAGPIVATRQPGEAAALVTGDLEDVDVAASAALVLDASWDEVVDLAGAAPPTTRRVTRQLGTTELGYDAEATTATVEVTPRFESTEHRRLRVRANAISRFTRWFIRPVEVSFATGDEQRVSGPDGFVETSFSLTSADGRTTFRRGTDYEIDPREGRLARLPTGGIAADDDLVALRAEGRGLRSTRETDTPFVEVLVPSSAPPPAPNVTEAVQVRDRQVSVRGARAQIRSRGQILRLHLARPWYVSGQGERLAVLLDHDPDGVPLTTRLGRDPRCVEEDGVDQLRVDDFPAADVVVEDVTATLADGRQVQVDAVGHTPSYDETTDEWVVDIPLRTKTYRPFVRLTVARLQPQSIAPHTDEETGLVIDPQLSVPVDLDSLRLGADRRVRSKVKKDGEQVDLRVDGDHHDGIPGRDGLYRDNLVRVTVQESDPTITDPELRWASTTEPEPLELKRKGRRAEWRIRLDLPAGDVDRRLLIEDMEPVVIDDGTDAGLDEHQVRWIDVVDVPRR